MRLTIGKKMGIMILVNGLLTLGSLTMVLRMSDNVLREHNELLVSTIDSLRALKSIRLEVERLKSLKDPESLKRMKQDLEDLGRYHDQRKRLTQHGDNPAIDQLLLDSEGNIKRLKERIDDVFSGAAIPNVPQWVASLEEIVDNVTRQIESYRTDVNATLQRRTKHATIIGYLITMMLIATTIGLSIWITGGIVGPTHRLTQTMTAIHREGDLTKTIYVRSHDEMGMLAETFNTLIHSLNTIVKSIRSATNRVSTNAGTYVTLASSFQRSSKEIAGLMEGMARGTTTQAKQIEKTSQILESLILSISQVASKAQQASEKTVNANALADQGSKSAKEAIAKMQQLHQVVNASATVVRRLGEQSKQIGQIVEAITRIAEETNLLALNTAIEAARAGDSASGFGVVAEEVRKLAANTAKAAEDITKLVKETQLETARAVIAIESGMRGVTEGTDIVNRAGSAMDTVVRVVWEATQLSEEISKATQAQEASCKEVRRAMAAVTAVADEHLRSSDEALQATTHQSASTTAMAQSAKELDAIAQELVETVKTFKV